MSSGDAKNRDYESLLRPDKGVSADDRYGGLSPAKPKTEILPTNTDSNTKDLGHEVLPGKAAGRSSETDSDSIADTVVPAELGEAAEPLTYAEGLKEKKAQRKRQKNEQLLKSDRWLDRNGHTLTFLGLYLFTFFVLYRPYELIPGMGFLNSGAYLLAVGTILIYIPLQLSSEGSLTILTTEVKCVLAMLALAVITMPISRDYTLAWKELSENYIKVVLMFIVMVNVIRTRARLMSIMWLAISISIFMSVWAIELYVKGKFSTEGYRVSLDIKGMFENPNEMALHFVTILPITLCLGLAAKNILMRLLYFAATGVQVAALMVSFSRGGFLAMLGVGIFIAFKLGRKQLFKVSILSIIIGTLLMLLAPGNYALRMMSIFIPGLDPVGSSGQRQENLILSIMASLRNPWGLGMGNSVTFGVRNLQTHNAFTQVSSELGLLGFAVYMIFLLSPFRKLGAIERTLYEKEDYNWYYYMAIGLQASLIGYMIASFFASVAYIWFVYYLIAYAVAFRRTYQLQLKDNETTPNNSLNINAHRLEPA